MQLLGWVNLTKAGAGKLYMCELDRLMLTMICMSGDANADDDDDDVTNMTHIMIVNLCCHLDKLYIFMSFCYLNDNDDNAVMM